MALWAADRPLAALLVDLHSIFPLAPRIELAPSAAEGDIRRAYMKAARSIHPDKVGGLELEQAVLAQVLFTAITAKWEATRGSEA